ncbi:MAG: DUF2089 domain-containing protein [Candidatus Mcinerneyibacterium aminivorans]|uniref:DUF2089 domain-containing protein n=1 Tax=Candidatus Mcinerneyibacterium aminivorans TaxID=2703815 RepID=A0A5D0MED4_9BACT|nr:MAG: DUF2089 domain-containing protein [Candidatus Mcinerneyibacterium aminivorans]
MEERKRILNMLSEGKISVEEAEKLLKAVKKGGNNAKKTNTKSSSLSKKSKNIKGKLRIVVNTEDGDNVNIAIPLKLAIMVKSMIPKEAKRELDNEGIDLNKIINNLNDSMDDIDEDLVQVESANGDKVRIYIDKEG